MSVGSVRLLLVDDEKHIRQLVHAVLSDFKGEIVGEATNGQEAVDMYKQLNPDIVFMDINMPVKDGREALKEIIAFDADARVVMLTSLTDMETVKDCMELGASNYVRKDSTIAELRGLFNDVLQELSSI